MYTNDPLSGQRGENTNTCVIRRGNCPGLFTPMRRVFTEPRGEEKKNVHVVVVKLWYWKKSQQAIPRIQPLFHRGCPASIGVTLEQCILFYLIVVFLFLLADHCVHYYDLRNTKQPIMVFKGHRKAVSYAKFVNGEEIVSA